MNKKHKQDTIKKVIIEAVKLSVVASIPFSSNIFAEEYIKPGTFVEITIPLPDKTEQFTGKVVLVRQVGESYEIGLWLQHQEDASRARIVEQICHIEVYMQEKKYRDGPYNLNPDRVAREWISKYASEVPSL